MTSFRSYMTENRLTSGRIKLFIRERFPIMDGENGAKTLSPACHPPNWNVGSG